MPVSLRHLIPRLAGLAALNIVAGASAASGPVVVTPQGPLIGEATADRAVQAFRGIPYAVPPVGVRRWTTATPAPDWTQPRLATAYGPTCVQFGMPSVTRLPDGREQPNFFFEPGGVASEDCLYLNVWAPAAPLKAGDAPRPVMVWIHGGALTIGSGNYPNYDGEALARKGVIVVSINYRLGIFGFFAHPELSRESSVGASGNYGIGDQVEALRWVKRNIGAFGGDPGNVTIFGESAGSFSVSMLLATPKSKGLFQKAIGESGAYFYPMPELRAAEAEGRKFAAAAAGRDSLEALRALTAGELEAKAEALMAVRPGEMVVVDHDLFDRPVFETFAQGRQHAVPVIVGFNSDEGSGLSDYYVVPAPPAPAAYEQAVQAKFGDLAGEWLKLYPSRDTTAAMFDAFRDGEFGWKMQHWAAAMGKIGAPAWLYYFSKTPPGGDAVRGMPNAAASRRVGAHHGAEIPYVFNHLDRNPVSPVQPSAADRRLAELMSDYWVVFAKTGDPNGAGRPTWQRYSDETRRYMSFGETAKPAARLLPGTLELQQEIHRRRIEAGVIWGGSGEGFAATLSPTSAQN